MCRSCSRVIPTGTPFTTRMARWPSRRGARCTTCWSPKRCWCRASTIRSPASPMWKRAAPAIGKFRFRGTRRFEDVLVGRRILEGRRRGLRSCRRSDGKWATIGRPPRAGGVQKGGAREGDMTNITRRNIMTGVAAAAAAAVAPLPAIRSPRAAAPAAGKQAPGFYRYRVGDYELTQIADGARTFPMPDGFVRNVPKEQALAAAEAAYMPKGMITVPFNPVIVNTG